MVSPRSTSCCRIASSASATSATSASSAAGTVVSKAPAASWPATPASVSTLCEQHPPLLAAERAVGFEAVGRHADDRLRPPGRARGHHDREHASTGRGVVAARPRDPALAGLLEQLLVAGSRARGTAGGQDRPRLAVEEVDLHAGRAGEIGHERLDRPRVVTTDTLGQLRRHRLGDGDRTAKLGVVGQFREPHRRLPEAGDDHRCQEREPADEQVPDETGSGHGLTGLWPGSPQALKR
jgi:hypothetical protein